MKILFAYTGISNIGFNAYYKKQDSVDSWYIPIGLCYLASAVLKAGHEVDLIDLRYLSGYDEVEKKIVSSDCKIVAFSFQTPAAKYAYEVARIAKKHRKITVAGGIHPTVLPDEVLSTGLFDHVVIGEGLKSFPQLVDRLEKGLDMEQLIVGEQVLNLDDILFPYYFQVYEETVIKKHGLVMMFTSRGCPGRCTFCQPVAHKLFGKRVIFRSADNIISEALHWQNKYNINRFMLVDDTFMTKKALVRELSNKLIALKSGLTWTCNGRANEFDDETVQLMAKSGCTWICIGFESGSQKILDFTKKGTTVEQNRKAAKLCRKYGIGFTTNILVGIPGETEGDYKLSYQFAKAIKATVISYNWLVPYPGTYMYEYCQQNNLLKKEIAWDGYEMNKIRQEGIITTVDYDIVRRWESKFIALQKNPLNNMADLWRRIRKRIMSLKQ